MSQATSLSIAPDGSRVAVAGREMLRTIALRHSQPAEIVDLLAHTRKHSSHSFNDVTWLPQRPAQLVTASISGEVLLWDMTRRGSRLVRTMAGHSRAVNRVSCNAADPPRLLSGSQDQTVRLWDLNARAGAQLRFEAGDEVRDVQWASPIGSSTAASASASASGGGAHLSYCFAVALETGNVVVFDYRSNRRALHKWQAHSGPAYALEYGMVGSRLLIATGGRDRHIRVWDAAGALSVSASAEAAADAGPSGSSASLWRSAGMSAATLGPQPVASVQTIAPVGRVKWRPSVLSASIDGPSRESSFMAAGGRPGGEDRLHIASCAVAMDGHLNIWDAMRPQVPLYTLRLAEGESICTGASLTDRPHETTVDLRVSSAAERGTQDPMVGQVEPIASFAFLTEGRHDGAANCETMVALTRSGALTLLDVAGAESPYANVSPVTLCWGQRDELLCSFSPEVIQRRAAHAPPSTPVREPLGSGHTGRHTPYPASSPAHTPTAHPGPTSPKLESSVPTPPGPTSPLWLPGMCQFDYGAPWHQTHCEGTSLDPSQLGLSSSSLPGSVWASPRSVVSASSTATSSLAASTVTSPRIKERAPFARGILGGSYALSVSMPHLPTLLGSADSAPILPRDTRQEQASGALSALPLPLGTMLSSRVGRLRAAPARCGVDVRTRSTSSANLVPDRPAESAGNPTRRAEGLSVSWERTLIPSSRSDPERASQTEEEGASARAAEQSASGDKGSSQHISLHQSSHPRQPFAARALLPDTRRLHGEQFVTSTNVQEQWRVNRADLIAFLAANYRTSGAPPPELASHNAYVAAAAGLSQLVAAWQALAFVICDPPTSAPAADSRSMLPLLDLGLLESSARNECERSSRTAHLIKGGVTNSSVASGQSLGLGIATGGNNLAVLLAPILEELLNHHSDCGDAQTCFALSRVVELAFAPTSPHPNGLDGPSGVGGKVEDGGIASIEALAPQQVRSRWLHAYVEQLHRLRQFASACSVVKSSDDERLRKSNARSTTVQVGGKLKARPFCGVCELPVRGLHVWCQGCGHGGHVHHLRDWFQEHVECPVGCGHRCLVRPCARRVTSMQVPAEEMMVHADIINAAEAAASMRAAEAVAAVARLSRCGGEFTLH